MTRPVPGAAAGPTFEPQDMDALREYAASYRAIEERGDLLTTALEQQREDQAMGVAWRRCEAALPEGWRMGGVVQRGARDEQWQAVAMQAVVGMTVRIGGAASEVSVVEGPKCPTPTAALIALAEKLEGMK